MTVRSKQRVGDELHVASRRDVFEAGQRARLIQPAMHPVRDRRPGITFVFAGRIALQPEPPVLVRGVAEAERLERDLKDCHPSFVSDLGARVPNRVPRHVESVFFCPYGFLLNG